MLRPTLLAWGLLLGSLSLPATGAAQAAASTAPSTAQSTAQSTTPSTAAAPVLTAPVLTAPVLAAPVLAAPVVPVTHAPTLAAPQPAGLTRHQDAAPLPAPKVPRESTRTNTALMVTGLAAVLVGAVVDDNDAGSILIVGGAVVGLIGLYRFLQ